MVSMARIATAIAVVMMGCGGAGPPPVITPAGRSAPPQRGASESSLQNAQIAVATESYLHDIVQLSVGLSHVCAVTTAGRVVCWGDNATGQLGVDSQGRAVATQLARPHVVGGLPPIAKVVAGSLHTCAIDRAGQVYCWGSAGADTVSTPGGTTGSIELHGEALGTPVAMGLSSDRAVDLALSPTGQACAAFAAKLRCWQTFQAIPNGAKVVVPPKVQTIHLDGVTSMAMGHGATCGVTSRGLYCWRTGGKMSKAVFRADDRFAPNQIAIGENYACAASAAGDVRCWWSLVDDFWTKPPNRDINWPTKAATRVVAVGDSPICTADIHGNVDCFLSDNGGLVDDAVADAWATTKLGPYPIQGVADAVEIGLGAGRDAMGYGFGCALRGGPDAAGAQVLCWGGNELGQLGAGNVTTTKAAVRVLAPME